jgi:hypothetical protein
MLYDGDITKRAQRATKALNALQALEQLRVLQKQKKLERFITKHKRSGPRAARTKPVTWTEFMAKPILKSHPKYFHRLFRMDEHLFEDLAGLLKAKKQEGRRLGTRGGVMGAPEVCETEVALAMTLRYLAGGALIDQCIIFNVPLSTMYCILKRTLELLHEILPPFELQEALRERETNPTRLDAIVHGFAARSMQTLQGAIGAIDGLLVPIRRPGGEEYERAFYTRKSFYGMNVQAVADVQGRIIHATVGMCPGACHDSFAWKQDPLCEKLLDGPLAEWLRANKRYLIGDDAYALSHTMVVPWPGKHSLKSAELAFNERHSSARISVECAFGMLCRKWLFLKRPFELSLKRTHESCGFQIAVVVAMKLSNLSMKHGSRLNMDVLDSDVTGEAESGAPPRAPRTDHRGRAVEIDPDIANLSGPNPRLARVEREAGNKEAARAEELPAWYPPGHPLANLSIVAEGVGDRNAVCETRAKATEALRNPRESMTQNLADYGIMRRTDVHW